MDNTADLFSKGIFTHLNKAIGYEMLVFQPDFGFCNKIPGKKKETKFITIPVS